MTDEERATLQSLQSHIDAFKISFWQRIAYILGGIVTLVGAAILGLGIWVGTVQESVRRGEEFDASISDHDRRLAVVESAINRAEPAIALLPAIQATLEAMRGDVAELKADVRRANENRRTP